MSTFDSSNPSAPWTPEQALLYVRCRLADLVTDEARRRAESSDSFGQTYTLGRSDGLNHALCVLDAATGSMAPVVRS